MPPRAQSPAHQPGRNHPRLVQHQAIAAPAAFRANRGYDVDKGRCPRSTTSSRASARDTSGDWAISSPRQLVVVLIQLAHGVRGFDLAALWSHDGAGQRVSISPGRLRGAGGDAGKAERRRC